MSALPASTKNVTILMKGTAKVESTEKA